MLIFLPAAAWVVFSKANNILEIILKLDAHCYTEKVLDGIFPRKMYRVPHDLVLLPLWPLLPALLTYIQYSVLLSCSVFCTLPILRCHFLFLWHTASFFFFFQSKFFFLSFQILINLQQIISLLTLLWQIIYLPLYNTLVKYYMTFFSLSYKINISILTSRIILSSELYLNQ